MASGGMLASKVFQWPSVLFNIIELEMTLSKSLNTSIYRLVNSSIFAVISTARLCWQLLIIY